MIFYKLFYRNSIHYRLPLKSTQAPIIRIRNSGRIFFNNTKFRSSNRLFADGGVILVGKNCFFNNGCSLTSRKSILIGSQTILGENVKIYDHNHIYDDDYVTSHTEFESSEVEVGSNCWIGSNVLILKGVTICDNVIIGSGSIVTKNISKPGVYACRYSEVKKIK